MDRTQSALVFRPLLAEDWPAVSAIYADGIAGGQATFETEPPSWERFNASRLADHRLVAEEGKKVLAWAAVSPVSARAVYRGVVEHSIYVAPHAQGRGIGTLLLNGLITETEAAGIWTIQTSIFAENEATLALHERAGFRIVGRRERIARMSHGPSSGQWRDTLLIERRSTIVL